MTTQKSSQDSFAATIHVLDTSEILKWDRRYKDTERAKVESIHFWSGIKTKVATLYGVSDTGKPDGDPAGAAQLLNDCLLAGRHTGRFRSVYRVINPISPFSFSVKKGEYAGRARKGWLDGREKAIKLFNAALEREQAHIAKKPKRDWTLEMAVDRFVKVLVDHEVSGMDVFNMLTSKLCEAELLDRQDAWLALGPKPDKGRGPEAPTMEQVKDKEQKESAARNAALQIENDDAGVLDIAAELV